MMLSEREGVLKEMSERGGRDKGWWYGFLRVLLSVVGGWGYSDVGFVNIFVDIGCGELRKV